MIGYRYEYIEESANQRGGMFPHAAVLFFDYKITNTHRINTEVSRS